MKPMKLQFIKGKAVKITDVPIDRIPSIKKIQGATFKDNALYVPAMYPHGYIALEDISNHLGIIQDNALAYLWQDMESTRAKVESNDLDGYTPLLKPYDHQIQGLSNAIHSPRFGLFLDPGLGKTKIGCDYILYLKSKNPALKVLILAMRVNLFTWEKEMEINSGNAVSLLPIKSSAKKQREKNILDGYANNCGIVVTYDSAKASIDTLLGLKFDLIICDESHQLRTPDSRRTKAILSLCQGNNAPWRRLILSGTPSLGNPMHLWGQLRFLGTFAAPEMYQFRARYLRFASRNSNIVVGVQNMDNLNKLVSRISMRKKAEECLDLPDRTLQIIEIDPSEELRQYYNAIINYKDITINGVVLSAAENAVTAMTKASQVSSGFVYKSNKIKNICDSCPNLDSCVAANIQPYTTKCSVVKEDPGRETIKIGDSTLIDSVCELVESHITDDNKVIVWARYHETLDSLYLELSKISKVYRYDHTTDSPQDIEHSFNSEEKPCIMLAQISMGIGVTFKAPIMVYAELSFSLDHWLQSNDRNYGIRAKGFSKLLIQVVAIRDSLTASTIELLSNKIDVSNLMSTRPNCVTCKNAVSCLAAGIKPFDDGCILPKTAEKITIPLKEI
jgi:hypothetical protein